MNGLKYAAILATLLAFMAYPAVADVEDTVEKSFKVNEGGLLTVDTDFGSIEVGSHSKNAVDVTIYRTVKVSSKEDAEDYLEDLNIDFDQSGDDVSVTVRYERSKILNWRNNKIRLKFVVTVPKKYNVDLKTSGGSIGVDDLQGKVNSKTSGGSLSFGNITGPVIGKTSGGSIRLEGCESDADVKTSGGSIKIGEVNGEILAHTSGGSISIVKAMGSVKASTSGGGITVEEVMGDIDASTSGGSIHAKITKQPKNPCRLATSGGGVTVHMAEGIGVDLDAKTSGGRVSTDFPVTVQGKLSKSSLVAEVNGGGPELRLRTSGGSIHLNKN